MSAHRCMFVHDDGTPESFTIYDREEGATACRVDGLAESQAAYTPGASLANTVDRLLWIGRKIVTVYAPPTVLRDAEKHAAQDPGRWATWNPRRQRTEYTPCRPSDFNKVHHAAMEAP